VLQGTSGDLAVTTTILIPMTLMEVLIDYHMANIILKHCTMKRTVPRGTGLLLISIKMLHLIPPQLFCPQEIKILDPFYWGIVLTMMEGLKIM
jgi:hypothetical protein